jgi:peptidoglycan/LPS O-acetylase OafA/YrhL
MVQFGDVSYSIYLLHILIIKSAGLTDLKVGLHAEFTSVVLIRLVVAMLTVIGLSLITYRFIEVPGRRWLRRVLTISPRMRADQTAPASG